MKNLIFGIFIVFYCVTGKAQNVQTYNTTSPVSCDGGAVLIDSLQFDSWIWFASDSLTIIQQNGSNLFGLCAGNYVLQLTNNGSSFYYPFSIDTNAVDCSSFQTYIDVIQHPSSPSSYDGFLACNLIGGTAPFSFAWNNGMNTQNANGIGVGQYEVCVTDANGCMACSNAYLDVDSILCDNFTAQVLLIQSATNQSSNDGVVQISFSGGTGPYTIYQLNDTIVSLDTMNYTLTGLNFGTFCVQISDSNACSIDACTYINHNDSSICNNLAIDVLTTQQPSSQFSQDGTAQITVSGGTEPYTLISTINNQTNTSQSMGQPGFTFTHGFLNEGVLCYTVVDANGCSADDCDSVISLNNPCNGFSVGLFDAANASSPNTCDGFLNIEVGNGTAPYTYFWNNGSTTADQSGLCQGIYDVIVTDANGCTTNGQFTINNNLDTTLCDNFTTQVQLIQSTSTQSSNDGIVQIGFSGGTAPYTIYQLNDTIISLDTMNYTLTGLNYGTFCVQISDSNGCSTSACTYINHNDSSVCNNLAIDVQVTSQPTSAFSQDGTAQITVSGGTEPYTLISTINNQTNTFQSMGQPGFTFTHGFLNEGVLCYTVVDANGCSANDCDSVISLNNPCNGFSVGLFDSANASSPNTCDGYLDIEVGNGTAPFSYLWNNGSTTADQSGLCQGIYDVMVTDANGCTASGQFTINNNLDTTLCDNFTAQIDSIVNQNTITPFDGGIYISVSGGSQPYSYNWSHGETVEDAEYLIMGNYSVTIQDANGCSTILSAIIDSNSYLVNCSNFYANIQLGQNATSTTINDAYVQVGFTGGTGPYTIYQLNDTIVSADTTTYYLYNLSYGTFCFQVEDVNGCITSACQYIGYGFDCSTFSASVQTIDASTFLSGCNGSAILQIQNGTAPYTVNNFQISGNSYNYLNLCPGFSNFNITDANGCVTSVDYTIGWNGDSTEVPPFMNAQAYTGNVSAENVCDGSVYLTVNGGILPLTFYDQNGVQVDQYQTGLCEGVYSNTIVDASGQIVTVNYFIASPFDIIDNTPFDDTLVVDTLINNVLQNCAIDFLTLDTAFISNVQFISMDSIIVTWSVIDGNGTIDFIESYSLNAGFGVYELIFQIFCPQRATDKYLIVREHIKIGGAFLSVEEKQINFAAYPNPVTDMLNIQLESNLPTSISITDISGKLVYTDNFNTAHIQINTSQFAKGQYFVNVSNEQLTTTKIIIK